MVKEILILLIILFSSSVFAQTEVTKSKIKFIDGSELQVVITENYPGKYVKIVFSGSEEVTIKYSSILSIKHKDYNYYSKYIRTKGFYIEGSASFLFGKASEYDGSRIGVALGVSANYQLNSQFSAGIGVEPTAILITNENFLIPVYAHFKINLLERRVAPVLMFDTGWSFVANNNEEIGVPKYEGGWFTRPAIGLQINNFTLSLGYQLQKITTIQENNWWWGSNQVTKEERLMKNIVLSTKFQF